VRVGDILLLEKPADQSPKQIDCYAVTVEDFAALGKDGVKYKLDPKYILFSLRRLHNTRSPDLELVVLQPPALWVKWVGLSLLNELSERDPQLRDRLRAATAPLTR
jgi:hypothetical protein